MSTQQIALNQVLYELEMSIGKSLVLDEMLRESLTVFIRELNCVGALVLHYQEQDDHTMKRSEVIALPRCIAQQDTYRPLIEEVPPVITSRGYSDLMARLPVTCHFADREVLTMAMPRFGVLYLVRKTRAFEPILIRSIEALVHRLGGACAACVQEDTMQTQKRLVQSEKPASIGQLAAGVAHEINNPTGFVASNLNTMRDYVATFRRWYTVVTGLQRDLSGHEIDPAVLSTALDTLADLRRDKDLDYILEDADALLQESLDGTDRIARIVKNLREFAHSGSDRFVLTPKNEHNGFEIKD